MIMDWSQMCAMDFYFEGPDRVFIGRRATSPENAVGGTCRPPRRTSDHSFKTAAQVHPPLPSVGQLDTSERFP